MESKPAEVVFEEVVEAKLGSISGTGFGCRNHTDLSTVRAGVILILILMLVRVGSASKTPCFGGAFLISIGLFCSLHYLFERKTRLREK